MADTDTFRGFPGLVAIMERLRDKETGCPWDIEQDFKSIYPYTIEEAYEVADAIERNDMPELRDELGDLALQVVFHAQMAKEEGHFDVEDVMNAICEKMVRRHPHVFEQADGRDSNGQIVAWEVMKEQERATKGTPDTPESALDGVALALPSLLRAEKLQKRAARTGFDWTETPPIFDKLDEEISELKDAAASGDAAHIAEELGDLLFVCANLARRMKIDPEQALRNANAKFERRFRAMEAHARTDGGPDFKERSLDEQEALWQAVKRQEKG